MWSDYEWKRSAKNIKTRHSKREPLWSINCTCWTKFRRDIFSLFIFFFYEYLFEIILIFLFPGSSGEYSSTSNAFIFSLHNKEGLAPFKTMVTNPRYAIYRGSDRGPAFGGGHDIMIADNANSNTNSYTNFPYSYSVPSGVQSSKTILAGTYNFTPDEVEVFYLGWVTLRSCLWQE